MHPPIAGWRRRSRRTQTQQTGGITVTPYPTSLICHSVIHCQSGRLLQRPIARSRSLLTAPDGHECIAARLVKFQHITPILRDVLHALATGDAKTTVITVNSISGTGLSYFNDVCIPASTMLG